MEVIEEVASDHQPNLKAEGIVINHFQAQAKLPQEAIETLLGKGFTVLAPYLSSSIIMRESHQVHVPLVYFRPRHKLAEEFTALAEGLLLKEAPMVGKAKPRGRPVISSASSRTR
jgi:chromosome partitioning protein